MPLVRYEIQSELALANRDLYRTAPKNDPEAILEGVAMVGLVGIVRQLGDLAEFAADVFHDLHEALLATASRSHDLVSRVSQLEGELGAVEKSMFSKKTNHLQFAYAPGVDWRATVPTDQNFCTQGDLPRFIRSAYEGCRGPPKLFLLDKFDVQGAGACLKRYTDPSFFKMEWASSEIMKAEKAQQQRKARRGKKARGRKDSDGKDVRPAVQFQPSLRRTLSKSSVEDASENIMTARSIPLNTTEGHSHQSSSENSGAAAKSPTSVRRFGFPKPLPPVTSLSRNSELKPKTAAFSRALEEDAGRRSTDVDHFLDAMTTMESETDSEPLERRRFYDGFKRTRTAQTKSDYDGDVFFEDARNSTMESETESKYSVELTPIPVHSHLEFEDQAVDNIERTESEQHEGDESGSWRKGVRVQKMDQYMQVSHLKETSGQEISQDITSKPDADNGLVEIEQSESASGGMHKSTGGPTNDQSQLPEDSNLEARNSEIESLHNELMDAEEAEEAEDEEQFDVELLRVIGYNAAEAEGIQKPEATVSEALLEEQTAKAPLTPEVEANKEAESVGSDHPDSAGLQMEAADNRSPEGSTVIRTDGIPSTNGSTLEADGTKLQAAEKYFSLDSHFEAGDLVRQETPEKQNSGASSTSGTSTSLHEAVLVEEEMEENVPLVDDFDSSSSEDVFMDADAGYQSSSRFSDADYNFRDASSEQFEQMESLSGRSEELPPSMQITLDKDDKSAADQHVYDGGHDTEKQVPETSEAVLEKQPGDQGTKEALLEQQQITEERTKEAVLEQQLPEQEALLEQPAEQIAEERWEEATQLADQATAQRIEEAVVEQEPAERTAEQTTKEAPTTVEQIADQTTKEASMAAEHVAEQISEEAVIEPQPREQVLEQGLKDFPLLGEQVLRQVKQTESPAKGLPSPVSSTGSPVLQFCPETGSEDPFSFKLGALSPPEVSSESSSSPSSSSSSSPRFPVFSALRAPLSPTRRAGEDERADIETFLAPSSPTSTSGLPSYPPSEPREMPPLPPLPPIRWLTSLPSRDSQLLRAGPSLSTPALVETTKPADEAHVPMQLQDAAVQQTDAPMQQTLQADAVEDEMLVDISLQHADAPKPDMSVPVHSRELDVGATAQEPPNSDEEDDDMPELEVPQPSPELASREVAHPPQRGLLETPSAERQEAEIGLSTEATGVPEQKASHLKIQEAATEASSEPEVPAAAVLENELEVTSAPLQEQEPGFSAAEEATGVPEQKASHLKIQETATEASSDPEVPAAAVLENELEVTSAPLQEQEPGFSAAEEATGVPEQKASPLEIQEAATEASSEPEVPGEPAAAVLENELEAPIEVQEPGFPAAEEASGVLEQKTAHPESATEASPQPEVPGEPAAAAVENELEVTPAPLQEQEPGFSAAEKEMIQHALDEDHSGPWRMAMQLEYDALKMKMEITETSQQTVEPTVADLEDVEEVVEQRLETELETSAKEIPEADAEVRRETGRAKTQEPIVVEVKHLLEPDAWELPAAGDVSTIPDSGEQLVLKQVPLDETEPGEVMVPEDQEERPESLDLVGRTEVVDEEDLAGKPEVVDEEDLVGRPEVVDEEDLVGKPEVVDEEHIRGRPEVVDEDELAAKQTLDKQSPEDQVLVPETPETEEGLKTQLSTADDDAPLVVFPKPGPVLEPTVEPHDTLPVSTMPPKKETGDDPLIKAVSQHDRSKLKKVASDLRPPPKAPDERDVLLEQIRSQSFNLRQTVPEKKESSEVRQQPRILSNNINVAAILEKANAIRQAFVGSDDDEDDDWSDS